MKTKLLTSVVVLLFVSVNIGIPCGNQAPTADLAADMDFGVTAQTMTVTFDGSGSSDPDGGGGLDNSGIYEFAWDFGDGQTYWESADYPPDGKFDGKHAHTYTNTSTESYVATLIVYDVSSEPSEEKDYSVYIWNCTIQDAIDAANGANHDTVAVAPGIYTGPGNCDLDFLGKAITVRSIDPNDPAVVAATIIDCYYDDEVYARGFCFDSGEGAESVVAGFTIINGWHDDNSGDDDNRGGAIYCIDYQGTPSSPTIRNCVFRDNAAPDGGGAIYCENSAPTITNCVFSNNEAADGDGDGDGDGGGIYAKGSTYAPTVTNCVFSKNTADGSGGGMCFEDASGIITDCNFVENYANGYGGGFSVFSEASPTTNPSPTLTNCFFNQNRTTQYGGGMEIDHSSPTVVNCVFNQNYASYDDEGSSGFGGGVSNSVSSSEFVNCTFYGNVAYGGNNGAGSGGGMYHYEDTTPVVVATITNCIFWENTDEHPNDTFNTDESAQIHHVGTQPGIENSCIDGLSSLSGTDNIDDDPLFVNADNPAGPDGVFRTYDDGLFLGIGGEEDSPCIDAGQTGGDVPEEDITGFARSAGFEDMGAYEARSVLFVYGTAEGEDDGTSWANAFVYLQDALDAAASGVDEIWVAVGTYHPDLGGGRTPGDKTESFELVDGVAVYGGFAGGENGHCERTDWEGNETILSGEIGTPVTQTDNSYHVVKGISIDDAIIDGFTISDGYAYGSSPDCYGGGIYLSGGSPTIQNCSIEGNHAYYYGGGMYCTSSSPVMVNCTFSGNTARRGGGMYSYFSSPMLTACVFNANTTTTGPVACGGMFNDRSSSTLTNCTFIGNSTTGYGGGMYNYLCSPIVTNCIFTGNSAGRGGGLCNSLSTSFCPTLINCTFSGNSATTSGGGMYSTSISAVPTLVNCIFWGNTAPDGPEIDNDSTSPIISYCDIYGCGGSGDDWDTDLGTDLGGNIDMDPLFVDAEGPDYDLRLKIMSPCIDAADGTVAERADMAGNPRVDIDYIPNIGAGSMDYVDMGAYEYVGEPYSGYITSFEICQGITTTTDIDDIDGWMLENGDAAVTEATLLMEDGDDEGEYPDEYPYQYVTLAASSNTEVSYEIGEECQKSFVRISCIPSPGSYIHVMNGASTIASIEFDADGETIKVLDGEYYQAASTGDHDYDSIGDDCRDFLENLSGNYEGDESGYSYESTWMEFTIEFDWDEHEYSVTWAHMDDPDGTTIYDEASFDSSNDGYTDIQFTATDAFYLNRMSISDASTEGGVVGVDDDAWLFYPVADILNPLKGRIALIGKMWYDSLGQWIIKACPSDLDTNDPNSWMEVCSGSSISQEAMFLGCWNAETYYNGDYLLKIEIYDDAGRKLDQDADQDDDEDEEFIWATVTVNGTEKDCIVRYPVTGRAKARTFHYEEHPDFTINWPGTFPFEFKRMYNNALRSRIYPLFFGWTHNHNIRLIEDCQFDWIEDASGDPVEDNDDLGVGRLWLCRPLGGEMLIGHVDTDPTKVIYEPLDKANYYVERTVVDKDTTTNPDEPEFEVKYVYHGPDGMKMTFQKIFTADHAVPADEGLVGWTVVAGIDTQEDRFGNALVYDYDWSGEEGPLKKIVAKVDDVELPANLQFEYNFAPFGTYGPQDLCSKITLYNDDTETDANVMFTSVVAPLTSPPDPQPPYYISEDNCYSYGATRGIYEDDSSLHDGDRHVFYYFHSMDQEFMLRRTHPLPWGGDYHPGVYCISARHDDDGTLIEEYERVGGYLQNQIGNLSPDWSETPYKRYDYEYDNEGNLITTIKVKVSDTYKWELDYDDHAVLLREEVAVTSPQGALLSKNIRTFAQEFDPNDYSDDWEIGSMRFFFNQGGHHVGGGGAIDTDYYYEDEDFPLKPTRIIEHFDDDGDGQYDRPSRTTTLEYDDRGNVLEQRIYVDDVNFVYTEYAYHDDYDFPTRQTTWQEYLHDQAGEAVKSGQRVEKQWFYSSDADDAFDNEPRALSGLGNSGEYLVRERTLLGEAGGGQWAETFYSYISGGRGKMKEDPVGSLTYYEYDDEDEDDGYGFPEKEWQGATLVSGSPTGDPQKRYYYDALGRKVLKADYLGKVQMNVYDDLGQVREARDYNDPDVMDGTDEDFEPDSYDERPQCDDYDNDPWADDWWQTRTEYSDYDPYNKPCEVNLPTGAEFEEEYVYGRYLCEKRFTHVSPYHELIYNWTYDGRIMYEARALDYGAPTYEIPIGIYHVYDSLWRLLYKYSFFGLEEPPAGEDQYKYIKHEEYQYDAMGNKTNEVVYSVERGESGFVADSGVIEKSNSYEYDILGRLVKQIIDDTDGGLNQTTEYGYDAAGNRIYVIDPAGNIIFSDYDNANRKIREYFALVPVIDVWTDEIDFIQTWEDAIPRKEVTYYDNGKVKSTRSYDYDGTSLLAGTDYTYDKRGRILTVKEFVTDDNDGIMESTDDIATTSYAYDDAGDLQIGGAGPTDYHIVITDAEGKETGIQLSYHGKTKKIMYPSGDYEEYEYYDEELDFGDTDPHPFWRNNGLLEKKTVWDGETEEEITYGYDDYGKVAKIIYPDNGHLDYTYTSRILGEYGKVAQITDHRSSVDNPGSDGDTYTFDYWYLTGQVKSYKNYDDYTVHYDYLVAYDRQTEVQITDDDVPPNLIYDVNYTYDLAGRLIDVCEPLLPEGYQLIASFDYDDNGNRDTLTYYLNGSTAGPEINYGYNLDNLLVKYATSNGPIFEFGGDEGLSSDWAKVDGLGRLLGAEEKLSKTSGTIDHSHIYDFDMRSQLIGAGISKIGGTGKDWIGQYDYRKDGNLDTRRIDKPDISGPDPMTLTSFTYLNDEDVAGDLTKTGRILDIEEGTNLVGYWKLDENADSTDVADSSGQGNDGTASQNTSAFHTNDAKIGTGAFNFDGSGDYVDLGTDDSLDLAGEEITLAAWIKPAVSGQTSYIVGKADASEADRHYGMLLMSGELRTYTDHFDADSTGFTPTVGEWSFVVMTWDGTTKTAYANGNKLDEWEGTAITSDNKSPLIGCRHDGTGVAYCFNGTIDDVMIISDALSDTEVAALYEGFTVDWDLNGNIATNDAGNDITYTFNWDNKLRKAEWPTDDSSIEIKYDPLGNRVWKKYTHGTDPVIVDEHKYIVDITGKLPVILMDLNITDSSLKKKYIYADRQILAQHDIKEGQSAYDNKYFYLHDRLGSVRLVLADDGDVVKYYTYEPFGEVIDDDGTFENAFRFTGQYFDAEIEEYYLRARQYNPGIARFTSRDSLFGKLHQPLTLNRYLYCLNNPINLIDPSGEAPMDWDWLDFGNYDWGIFDDDLSFEELLDIHNNMENLPIPDYNTGEQIALMASMALADYLVPGVGTSVILLIWAAEAGPYLERIGYMNVLHNEIIETAIDAYDW